MPAAFVVVPQWQGSGSSRAMRLVDGAQAIRGDLPSASTTIVPVPLEAGDAQGSRVHRLSSIAAVRDRLADALTGVVDTPIMIGGDCGVELGAIPRALRDNPGSAVVWFDAHPDLNTEKSSTSGAFHGMVLRTLLGDGPQALVPDTLLAPSRVILAGARSFDPEEDAVIAERSIRCIASGDVSGDTVLEAIEQTGADAVYLHIDLDVIDPCDIAGMGYPEPFGIRAAAMVDTVKAVLARYPLVGAGITEFAPASEGDIHNDMPTILRLLGALSSAAR